MRGQLRIEQMYAFIALDPADNTEGIVSFFSAAGRTPMVGADMKMVDKLRPLAEKIARQSGMKITLCRFEIRTELETLGGGG